MFAIDPMTSNYKLEQADNRVARCGHAKARPVAHIDLTQPGRLRVGHLLTLLSISHSALYERLRSGRLPKPDGHDPRPYWRTTTILALLQN